jgi:cytochrome c6
LKRAAALAQRRGGPISMNETGQGRRTETMKTIVKDLLAALLVAGLMAFAVPAAAADGDALWTKNCTKCHGADGKGDTKIGKKLKVKDMTSADWQKATSDEAMTKDIKEGKGDPDEDGEKPMPAYPKLTDEEVKALVAHVRSLKK